MQCETGSVYITLAGGTARAQEYNSLLPAEKADGWQLLFDGSTLAGWADPAKKKAPGDSWLVENGCLKPS